MIIHTQLMQLMCPNPHKYFILSECLYADNSILVGGDIDSLDEWSPVKSTAACIDLCRERDGCKYWTITKGGEDSKCQLKAWRGVLEKQEGFISGSLPSACCKDK